jgi:hypothetical protein
VDALVRGAQSGDNAVSVTEAKCLAPKVVAAIGLDRIKKAGVSVKEFAAASSMAELHFTLAPDAEQKFGDALGGCLTSTTVSNAFTKALGFPIPPACASVITAKTFGPVFGAALLKGSAGAEAKSKEVFADVPGACAERLMLGSIPKSNNLTHAQQDCIATHLDDGDAAKLWHGTITQGQSFNDPQLDAALENAIAACR